jgi:hypothetical protein
MLSVVVLSVVMLSVILSTVVLNVVAPVCSVPEPDLSSPT